MTRDNSYFDCGEQHSRIASLLGWLLLLRCCRRKLFAYANVLKMRKDLRRLFSGGGRDERDEVREEYERSERKVVCVCERRTR